MAPAGSRRSFLLLGAAAALFALPLAVFLRWMSVAGSSPTFEQAVERFSADLPELLRPRGRLELASAGICVASALLALTARRHLPTGAGQAAVVVALLALLLGAWNLWTLM